MNSRPTISCPSCGKTYSITAKNAGKKAKCVGCKEFFNIPTLSDGWTDHHATEDEVASWLGGLKSNKPAESPQVQPTSNLMECPDCKATVSIRAASCPRCGCPINETTFSTGPIRYEQRGSSSEHEPVNLELAILKTKDFTGKAILCLILYFVLYVPGLIANFAFLDEANRVRNQLGREPAGRGCLTSLAFFFFWAPLVLLIIGFVISIFQ